jgi:adenine-specific DNA-methyltransferase
MSDKDKLHLHTPNLADRNFAALAALFPNAVTETIDENGAVVRAIDADVLAQEINSHVVKGKEERYQFTWPDKKKSVLLANAPIAATLRPCREESVDFDNTENLYIEGDNLDVLKLLRETYLNRVKMIYIDPPYNTGNDFVYNDDFAEDTDEFYARDYQYDDDGNRMVRNLDSNGRFHTDWLNMIYPRLRLARDLLTDDGVIFISIDDNEVENLKKICNEVFGEGNFVAGFIWQSRQNKDNRNITGVSIDHEYLLCYGKHSGERVFFGSERKVESYSNPDNDSRGAWASANMVGLATEDARPNLHYDLINPKTGVNYGRPAKGWRYDQKTMQKLIVDNRIIWPENKDGRPRRKAFLTEISEILPGFSSIIEAGIYTNTATKEVTSLFGGYWFDFPKPSSLIKTLIQQTSEKYSIILDFFSGSATTAHAIMQLNAEDGGKRRFIMVQLPEVTDESSEAFKAGYKNICEIGKERIRRAGAKIKSDSPLTTQDLDTGFRVLKLDSTNMKDVYYTPQEYTQRDLDGLIDNIKSDRTPEDLLFQVMLDLGIPLSAKIERDGSVFHVNGNYLIVCFEKADDALVTTIAQAKPYYAVFRDGDFASDSALVNFEQIFATYSPTTIRRVL